MDDRQASLPVEITVEDIARAWAAYWPMHEGEEYQTDDDRMRAALKAAVPAVLARVLGAAEVSTEWRISAYRGGRLESRFGGQEGEVRAFAERFAGASSVTVECRRIITTAWEEAPRGSLLTAVEAAVRREHAALDLTAAADKEPGSSGDRCANCDRPIIPTAWTHGGPAGAWQGKRCPGTVTGAVPVEHPLVITADWHEPEHGLAWWCGICGLGDGGMADEDACQQAHSEHLAGAPGTDGVTDG